ncbi:hypothetical protein C0991_011568 [Blastosporella zonata]|nr:hypothetical protein C0991_011568 [Blastosporella zonata]
MRFTALIAAASVAISGVVATPLALTVDTSAFFPTPLSARNNYGAPIPPWTAGHNPGWYYGSHPNLYPELTCLEGIICTILELLTFDWIHCPKPPPHTPPPSGDGYTQTFSNLTGATQASDYQTYGLVDTVADCKAMCNSVSGCTFVNSRFLLLKWGIQNVAYLYLIAYHDVNGKGGSTQLTCSLFTQCHDASDADNVGGQSQPDGSIDYITDSDGWCKE